MKIVLLKPRGFCAGVRRAIEIVEHLLLKYKNVYVKHQIVHNQHVTKTLEEKGAVFVKTLQEVPDSADCVVFSAHGSPPSDFEEAKRRNLNVIDATCPLVTQVHRTVTETTKKGYHVVVIGHEHVEVKGTKGYANPDKCYTVATPEDVKKLNIKSNAKITFVCQTTLSVSDVQSIKAALKEKFPDILETKSSNVCYATENRQQAVKSMSNIADLLLVIGSKNSSNSNRLAEVGSESGIKSFLIDTQKDINDKWFKDVKTVAITAGASAPEVLVEEMTSYIANKFPNSTKEVIGRDEDVLFFLPKDARTENKLSMLEDYGCESIHKSIDLKTKKD